AFHLAQVRFPVRKLVWNRNLEISYRGYDRSHSQPAAPPGWTCETPAPSASDIGTGAAMSIAQSARIHPTAIVSSNVDLGDNVEVGAYAMLEGDIQIGPD